MPARIDLHTPTALDQAEFLRLARASRALHGTWVRAPATPTQYVAYLRRMDPPGHDAARVRSLRFEAAHGHGEFPKPGLDAIQPGTQCAQWRRKRADPLP